MTTTIQDIDFSVDLLKALLWQDNSAEKIESLLQQKQDWYNINQEQFWSDWVTNVFDLRTANQFGLAVWAIILGMPTSAVIQPLNKINFGFGIANQVPAVYASATWHDANASGITFTGGQADPNGGTNAVKVDLSTASGSAKCVRINLKGAALTGTCAVQLRVKLVSGSMTGVGTSDVGGGATSAWPALTVGVWTTVTLNCTAGAGTYLDLVAARADSPVLMFYWPQVAQGTEVYNNTIGFNHGTFGSKVASVVGLTLDQIRILLQLRYQKLICRPTVPKINRMLKALLGDTIKIYVLDAGDMSFITYVMASYPSSDLAFVLQNFDVLPRPAAVGIKFIVGSRATFGFGPFNKNFNHGTFGS